MLLGLLGGFSSTTLLHSMSHSFSALSVLVLYHSLRYWDCGALVVNNNLEF